MVKVWLSVPNQLHATTGVPAVPIEAALYTIQGTNARMGTATSQAYEGFLSPFGMQAAVT